MEESMYLTLISLLTGKSTSLTLQGGKTGYRAAKALNPVL
jgi:hypothetical protein